MFYDSVSFVELYYFRIKKMKVQSFSLLPVELFPELFCMMNMNVAATNENCRMIGIIPTEYSMITPTILDASVDA